MRAEVSIEQIDEFITLPFHGRGAGTLFHVWPPPAAVPPWRPPLILGTPQTEPGLPH